MSVKINPTWGEKLVEEFQKDYFKQLTDFVKKEYLQYKIYPTGANIFKAFDACNFDDVRVVIIGQDPYHGEGQANGLCFSVNDGIKFPPSLQNIFKEIQSDLGKPFPKSGNLERWAEQGVLLLNATLTVRADQAGSHQNQGWEQFTDTVIAKLASERSGIVFLLWGSYAQKKGAVIDPKKHCILTSVHPSPLSAHRGFLGCKHFSKANAYLKSIGEKEIDW